MAVLVNGSKLIPAPLCTVTRTKEEEKGDRTTAVRTTVQLKGTLLADRGSPNSSGTFWTVAGDPPDETIAADATHSSLLVKQRALRALLETQNQVLELQGWNGSTTTKWVVRLRELTFDEGLWYNTCPWRAVFDADEQGVTNAGVESLSESWQMEVLDENLGTYRCDHTIAVRGRTQRNAAGATTQPAWEHARNYALTTVGLGLDSSKLASSGVMGTSSLTAFNYLRKESIDEVEGAVSIGESWVALDVSADSIPATHEQTLSKRSGPDGVYSVTVEGVIQGLRGTNNSTYATTSTKVANRDAKWAAVHPTLFATASGWFGSALSTAVQSDSLQTNQAAGSLSYAREFTNRASRFGGVSERVSVRDVAAPDIYAGLPVPGRASGPILQDLSTVGARRRTVSIEVQMPGATTTFTPTQPSTTAFLLTQVPSADRVFLDENVVDWGSDGRYTQSVTWTYV